MALFRRIVEDYEARLEVPGPTALRIPRGARRSMSVSRMERYSSRCEEEGSTSRMGLTWTSGSTARSWLGPP